MAYQCFDVTIENQIAHLILNRPDKRNSMTPAFWQELPEIIEDIDNNARARVIVISATGPAFSAGMDLAVFANDDALANDSDAAKAQARLQHGARFHDTAGYFQHSFNCLENCRIPVIAAIQGACVGGGVDFVTACDMRFATSDAFLSIFEINIGCNHSQTDTLERDTFVVDAAAAGERDIVGNRAPVRYLNMAAVVQDAAAKASDSGVVDNIAFDDLDEARCKVAVILRIDTRCAHG